MVSLTDFQDRRRDQPRLRPPRVPGRSRTVVCGVATHRLAAGPPGHASGRGGTRTREAVKPYALSRRAAMPTATPPRGCRTDRHDFAWRHRNRRAQREVCARGRSGSNELIHRPSSCVDPPHAATSAGAAQRRQAGSSASASSTESSAAASRSAAGTHSGKGFSIVRWAPDGVWTSSTAARRAAGKRSATRTSAGQRRAMDQRDLSVDQARCDHLGRVEKAGEHGEDLMA